MRNVVVAGFGSFDNVINNPSSAIAVALDGCVLGDLQVIGREMPVSYARSVDVCEMWVRSTQAVGLIGIGVAMDRTEITIERTGVRPNPGAREDVDGRSPGLMDAARCPPALLCSINVDHFADGLGGRVGDDAGGYVCNAWLYQALLRFEIPVVFIHVPPMGLDSGKLLTTIHKLWG